MTSLTGSFALTRERPPMRRPVPLGGKLGGKTERMIGMSRVLAGWQTHPRTPGPEVVNGHPGWTGIRAAVLGADPRPGAR